MTNLFQDKKITDYFSTALLNKVRYACVRSVEQELTVNGNMDTPLDHRIGCFFLASAILTEAGFTPPVPPKNVDSPAISPSFRTLHEDGEETLSAFPQKAAKKEKIAEPKGPVIGKKQVQELLKDIAPTLSNADRVQLMHLPLLREEANESTKKELIKQLLSRKDFIPYLKSLGLPVTKDEYKMKKATLLDTLYT